MDKLYLYDVNNKFMSDGSYVQTLITKHLLEFSSDTYAYTCILQLTWINSSISLFASLSFRIVSIFVS